MIRKIATIIRWSKRYLQKFLSKYRSIFMLNPVGNMLNGMFDHSQYKHFVSLVFVCITGSLHGGKNVREKSQLYPLLQWIQISRSLQSKHPCCFGFHTRIRYTNYPAFPLRSKHPFRQSLPLSRSPVIRLVINCINRHCLWKHINTGRQKQLDNKNNYPIISYIRQIKFHHSIFK